MRIMIGVVAVLLLAGAVAAANERTIPQVVGSGDLNGDGLADILVSRPGDGGPTPVFALYQLPGAPGALRFDAGHALFVGEQVLVISAAGEKLAAQDVNRDGRADLVFEQGGRRLAYYQLGADDNGTLYYSAPTRLFNAGTPVTRPASPPAVTTAANEIVMPPMPQTGAGAPQLNAGAPQLSAGAPAVRPVGTPVNTGAGSGSSSGITVPPLPVPNAGGTAGPAALPPPTITRPALNPAQPSGLTVAVIDFANDARDPGLDWLRQGAPDVVAMTIPSSGQYTVLPRARFLEAELNLANIDEVFRGVRYVVKGNYWLEGDVLLFDVAVVDMELVDIVRSFSVRGSRSNIAPLMEQLQQQVREYFATGFPPAR